ncbi:MAG: ATP synthase F1 subunit gamma [Lachnospiraceae bacterium]|nr:ATP synthase F1 subunit gamma [Lachnospiraceae bacterium]
MASMRDIKRRKSSIQSTGQITKAMKLVATVKLQKARGKAEQTKPYSDCMYRTVQSILERTQTVKHPYLQGGESKKKAVIVMTSNRGLAGGYNSNVVKLITRGELADEQLQIYAVGKKGRDALSRAGYEVKIDASEMCEEPTYADASVLSRQVLSDFAKGEVGEIWLAYTFFKNTVVHEPRLVKLLPVECEGNGAGSDIPMNFEAPEEQILDMLIPTYVTSLIYAGLLQAAASENGARMQAMDSATSNAEEMIEDLTLLYNRARQGSITQELTEIIAGASAIT